MVETKHTPGPWSVFNYDCGDMPHRDHNGPCPGIFAPEEQDCAIVHWDGFKQKYWSSANGNQSQIEANARLIAAAPELLEALSAAEEALTMFAAFEDDARYIMGNTNFSILLMRKEQVRAAIVKATGEAKK